MSDDIKPKKKEKKSDKNLKTKDKKSTKTKSKKSSITEIKDDKSSSNINLIDEQNKLKQNLSGNNTTNIFNPNKNIIQENCEGCFSNLGHCYCSDCGKIYCKICDDQLHIIPAFRNHSRILLSNFNIGNILCFHHNLQIKFFCESCQEPICSECKNFGPHNNFLIHKSFSIFDLYRKYKNNLFAKIKNFILPKNEKIENILIEINNILKENQTRANLIIKGINNEYNLSKDKIKKENGKKMAILNFDTSVIQKDIIDIQTILDIIDFDYESEKKNPLFEKLSNNINILSSNNDVISFLLQFHLLLNKIDKILSKPTNSILSPNDINDLQTWPNELNDYNKRLKMFEKQKLLLKLKDDIIWKLIHLNKDKNVGENTIKEIDEINQKSNNEINEWKKLSEKYINLIQKYKIVCCFCGCFLDKFNVNELCSLNNNNKMFINRNFTNEIPHMNWLGNFRHFFSEPSNEYLDFIKSGKDQNERFNENNFVVVKNNEFKEEIKDDNNIENNIENNNNINNENIIEEKPEEEKNNESQEKKIEEQESNNNNNNTLNQNRENSNSNNNTLNQENNPFNKNILTGILKPPSKNMIQNQRYNLNEFYKQEWFTKIQIALENNNINLYEILTQFDFDNDGFITINDLFIILSKINLFLTENDKENIKKFIDYSNYKKDGVDIQEFSKNFKFSKKNYLKSADEINLNKNNLIKEEESKLSEEIHSSSINKNKDFNDSSVTDYLKKQEIENEGTTLNERKEEENDDENENKEFQWNS